MVVDSKKDEGTKAGVFSQHGTEEISSRSVSMALRSFFSLTFLGQVDSSSVAG